MPILHGRVWSTPWCVEPRMQTFLAGLLRARLAPRPCWERELLTLSDGGTIALEWAPRDSRQRGLLLLLPGLAGAADADYVTMLRAAADRLRLRAVVLLPRGRHAPLTTARLYSALSHGDVGEALAMVRDREHGPLLAAGVSLGGLMLVHLLAEQGAGSPLSGALLLSAPLDVPACELHLRSERMLSRALCAALRRTLEGLPALHTAAGTSWRAARSLREFDASFTAPHWGFSHVDEYYSAACARRKLCEVRVPLLAVAAADDPLQPESALPLDNFSQSPCSALLLTARGGHIGFMTGWWPSRDPADHFVSRVAEQYFDAILSGSGADRS